MNYVNTRGKEPREECETTRPPSLIFQSLNRCRSTKQFHIVLTHLTIRMMCMSQLQGESSSNLWTKWLDIRFNSTSIYPFADWNSAPLFGQTSSAWKDEKTRMKGDCYTDPCSKTLPSFSFLWLSRFDEVAHVPRYVNMWNVVKPPGSRCVVKNGCVLRWNSSWSIGITMNHRKSSWESGCVP